MPHNPTPPTGADAEAALEIQVNEAVQEVIDCDLAMANLFTFIDAELDIHELELMRGHIDDCPECLYEEELGRKLKGVIQRTCVERAPEALRERVTARLAELRAADVDES
jgi:mycothiol system anti-sigma-R factor